MNLSKRIISQNGQMTIEMILLMTMGIGVALTISNSIRENQVLAGIVEGPWVVMQGMIEDGVWKPAGASKAHHPSQSYRHRSFEGNDVPGEG